jgi:hypothetical protein
MTQRSVPNEKNQNSSDAQKRCCTVAVEKLVKNARVSTHATGIRKIATICFTQRAGITHSVSARSSCVLRPVLSLRRRRFFTVESTALADYQRALTKGEPQQKLSESGYSIGPWLSTRWAIGPLAPTYRCTRRPTHFPLRPTHVRSGSGVHSDDFALFDK